MSNSFPSHSSSKANSYTGPTGASASSSSTATSPNGETSTSEESTYVPGATSAGASASATASDAGASTAATAFAGDAEDLILWHNTIAEETLLWAMEDFTPANTYTSAFDLSPDWRPAGIADLNGDDTPNLLWRNQTTGELIITGITNDSPRSTLTTKPGLNWVMEATGDFNNDGIDDLLWHNAANGDVGLWLMNDQGQAGSYSLLPNVSGDTWSIGGAGDFNQDGHVDILWKDANTDDLYVWVMENGQFTHQVLTIDAVVDESWTLKGVGDYNSDGYDDILWLQNNGDVGLWRMQGTSVLSRETLQGVSGEGWLLIA